MRPGRPLRARRVRQPAGGSPRRTRRGAQHRVRAHRGLQPKATPRTGRADRSCHRPRGRRTDALNGRRRHLVRGKLACGCNGEPKPRPLEDPFDGRPRSSDHGCHIPVIHSLDVREHEHRARRAIEGSQPHPCVLFHSQVTQGRRSFGRRRGTSATDRAEHVGAQPCGSSFRVPQLVDSAACIAQGRCACRCCATSIAGCDEQREAVQPPAVKVAEGGAHGIGSGVIRSVHRPFVVRCGGVRSGSLPCASIHQRTGGRTGRDLTRWYN